MKRAIFAGGCFWCLVQPFETYPGVCSVLSGYTGGHVANPSYEEVCSGKTGHTEAVEIIYDESKVSYQELLEIYWAQTDPTDAFGQFQDRGDNYRPIIFYENAKQKELAEASKAKLQASGRFDDPIVTQIEPAQPFYPAEDYHQQFYKKDPLRYTISSGLRHKFIEEHWKDWGPPYEKILLHLVDDPTQSQVAGASSPASRLGLQRQYLSQAHRWFWGSQSLSGRPSQL